jgi:DNA-binding MarR family transcriptional regulator
MNKLNNKIKDNFTIIPNEIIRNKSLSDRARFIFCYMASMPDDWKFYQSAMAKELGYTKDTLRKYIEELLETGYLNREQRRETGKFDSYDYTLNFTPSGKNTDTVKNRHDKKPTRENSTLINKDFKEKKTITNKDFKEYPENSKEFSPIKINGIEIKENKNGKVNPFQLISELQKEETKEKVCDQKEKAEPTERKPNPTYEAFTIFCETFERLSGANYPKDKNGNYLMSKKDAGGMVYLMRNVEQVDRNGNSIEALKVFVRAAWNLNDKWIRANFTPNTLYGQFSKIFTGYQTSSPEMIEKKKNDRIAELLAEKMKQYEND